VYNQTAFLYEVDRSLPGYISLAGGYTENADRKNVYVLKADGTAVRPSGGKRGPGYQVLEPGDTIVVPEKLEKTAWLREVKDITQILYQIAVTAGVLIVAF
jgi:polysaccharide export outer membrane protein